MIARREFIAMCSALPLLAAMPSPPDAALSRIDELISRMTLAEKVTQLTNESAGIPRLGIPAYNWWNEALHGVARAGIATVFPQAIGMAATWNASLIERVGDAVSTEARAKFNAADVPDHGLYHGLTFWSPNINLFRDPRWGRGQETYGEDPVLTSVLAGHYVGGLQGRDPQFLKAAACAKHFAVHSGPEPLRDHFNVNVDEKTLNEYYLVAFRHLVRDAGVAGVMSAYSSVDGTPCSANTMLLRDKLRHAWSFQGYVTSDCGAVDDLTDTYRIAKDMPHAAALALNAGVDVSCGEAFASAGKAVAQGLVSESRVDDALRRLLGIRFRLGLFEPPDRRPFANIKPAENDSLQHAALALQTAREAIVLLKNDAILPLSKVRTIALVGPNADSLETLLGNYNGTPSRPVTLLSALREKLGTARVRYVRGCDYVTEGGEGEAEAAVDIARESDVVIFAGGISPRLEGEAMKVDADGFLGGDRTRIELPKVQTALMQQLVATGKPLVYVQFSGSAIACVWEAGHAKAVMQAWYPGESGGTAIADVLFGDYNPAGRLPVTFYSSTADLPAFEDYQVTNRTYRHFAGTPLFAFGHGLSYTRFKYGPMSTQLRGETVEVSVTVQNAGARDGDEVVQVYAYAPNGSLGRQRLCGFARAFVPRGQSKAVALEIPLERLAGWDEARKRYVLPAGTYELRVSASSADIRLRHPLAIARELSWPA